MAERETTLRDPGAVVLPHSPVGRVPTLVLADGTVLTETALILPYLDTLGGAYPLLPPATLSRCGQVLGLLEGMAVWNRELRRPEHERSPGVIALETTRVNRVADTLEAQGWTAPARPDAADILLGCALGYAERRHRAWPWRQGHPALARVFDTLAERPSFRDTLPPLSGI
ncbi:glutathione S-transferase family protein [Paeniroseomonas aquatica]|uniref:glutathione S-transferase family protein n=1 Tax=Paeniroseomonas aquatica TaxID=373043 RepID=UPI00361C1FFF